jgi:hypothetical protein
MLMGGVLMVSLGIIGTYIAQIYQEVKYRPRYVVSEALAGPEGEKGSRGLENNQTQAAVALANHSSG